MTASRQGDGEKYMLPDKTAGDNDLPRQTRTRRRMGRAEGEAGGRKDAKRMMKREGGGRKR